MTWPIKAPSFSAMALICDWKPAMARNTEEGGQKKNRTTLHWDNVRVQTWETLTTMCDNLHVSYTWPCVTGLTASSRSVQCNDSDRSHHYGRGVDDAWTTLHVRSSNFGHFNRNVVEVRVLYFLLDASGEYVAESEMRTLRWSSLTFFFMCDSTSHW